MSPLDPQDPTVEQDLVPEPSPSARRGSEVSRPNMGFVEGTQPGFSEETAGLLRSRLKAAALVLSVILVVAFVGNLFSGDVPLVVVRAAILLAFVGSFFALQSPRVFSLVQLRWFEAGLFGALLVQLSLMMWARVAGFARAEDPVSLVAAKHSYLAAWSTLILTYSILMPNRWSRALAVLLPVAALPYALLFALSGAVPGVAAALEADRMGAPFPMVFLAVLVAVFGTHVINSIRREAFKAKQLGQYVLRGRLGAGGMGEVYRAEHQLLKRPCAVKLIKPGKAADAATLVRFEREVQATARLTHANTVEVFDYGRADDGTFYYVMEFLPGLSLEDLVKGSGPLPPERAVHFLRQVCKALREAHGKGLIHRDIKPANVFAAERGGVYDVAKLLDFGLVREQRAPAPDDLALTQPGTFSGSPLYMCPEQVAAYHHLDARSDIYSLGAVAYYLVTGRPPFVAANPWEVIAAHARDPIQPPAELNPAVPPDLELVIIRCLAKKPANRYPDVEGMEKALAACECANKWSEEQAAAWWRERDGA